MKFNPIIFSDTYKNMGHWFMMPDGIETLQSYFENRTGALWPKTQFVGLQYYIKDFLLENPVRAEHIEEAQDCAEHHVFNREAINVAGWKGIIDKYGGYAPFKISAVAEGLSVPINNVLYKFDSAPEYAWVNGHYETIFTNLWATLLCGTISKDAKDRFGIYWDETVGHRNGMEYSLHDFGARSVDHPFAQASVGMAHLVNFMGTDTTAAVKLIADYYQGGSYANIAHSVPATEHSISTITGEDNERGGYLGRILNKYPNGIVSIVSDTYHIERLIKEYVLFYKDLIIKRYESGQAPINKTVFRPDSLRWDGDTPEDQTLWIIEELANIFGFTTNNKGHKELHPSVGVLWGDGIDTEGCTKVLDLLKAKGWAANNIVFGMGGKLLNNGNRDTQRSAFKASFAKTISGEEISVQKNPMDKSKASKGGDLVLIRNEEGRYVTTSRAAADWYPESEDLLVPVYDCGKLLKDYTWQEVRDNSNN